MKTASWMLLLALSAPLQAVPRNPFVAPFSPCEVLLKRLDGWQLRGVLYLPEGSVALLNLSGQRWRRVAEGQSIEPEVRVAGIRQRQVTVSLKGACEGRYYHWNIQGGAYDKAYRGGRADAGAANANGGGE
ncbi:HofP DNA utilization family protein [Cedecea sp.]|jgi:pilus assembly protein HofP|uniref:HofP DNA utilization family protein n=1 Tax=Cedecea sp. TaxID=1970739 RepID=UPI0012AE1842|nr:DUF2531 family protein [Enterobacteriaceae bacterium RIT693]